MTSIYLTGPALDVIRSLPDASVDLVATSPPFLALRNYNDIEGQWGGEPTPAAFLDNLLELAAEFRRVLTPTGSIAIELGDSYSGSGGGGGDYLPGGMRAGQVGFDGTAEAARAHNAAHWRQKQEAKHAWPLPKSLTGVPTLFAWSLAYSRNLLNPEHTVEPWRVRNIIVWARNNPAVGALGDKVRPATSYITVACPSGRRWFDLDAVRTEPSGYERRPTARATPPGQQPKACLDTTNPAGAPPLDYWTDEYDGDLTWLINTQGSKLAHYAMWPAKLAERLILSMCPAEVCRACGEPRRRIVECEPSPIAPEHRRQRTNSDPGMASVGATGTTHMGITRKAITVDWSECPCADYRPGVVLDPFAGTGTTLHVAEIHGRDAIGIDLDPANRNLVDRRRVEVRKKLLDEPPPNPSQVTLDLWGAA